MQWATWTTYRPCRSSIFNFLPRAPALKSRRFFCRKLCKSTTLRRIYIVSNLPPFTIEAAAVKACDICVKPFSFAATEIEL